MTEGPGSVDALHMAVMKGDSDAVQGLLDAGVSPDDLDSKKFGLLHYAAQEYRVEAARILLGNGATVDLKNKFGNTPLFVAVFNSRGRGDLIHLLLESGADPHSENLSEQTPYGLAKLIANYDVKQFFE